MENLLNTVHIVLIFIKYVMILELQIFDAFSEHTFATRCIEREYL